MTHPNTKLLRAIGMMIGAVVGAGVFGLPYAFSQSGVGVGLLWLFAIGGMLIILQLMLAEVSIQTPGRQRLVGLVERYIGRPWRWVAAVALASGIWGAMLAYMLIGGKFLHLLLSPALGGPEMLYSLIIWVVSAAMIYRGLNFASKYEIGIVISLIFLFIFIILLSVPEIDPANYFTFDFSNAFVPYGVLLFSMAGIGIVPEMADVLGKREKQDLGRSIVIAMTIIMSLYLFFSLAVVGVTGAETSQAAFDGLIPVFGESFRFISTLLGSITILSIYMILGIEILNTFRIDFKMSHRKAWLLTVSVPLVLFFFGIREFISLIGFIGGVLGGVLGILIALTYWKMKRSPVCTNHHCLNFPPALTWLVICLFAGGILAQIASLLL